MYAGGIGFFFFAETNACTINEKCTELYLCVLQGNKQTINEIQWLW